MNVHGILRTARLASWTYRVLSTVVGLVTIRLINDRVGLAGYGEVALVLAFLASIAVIDFGFLQALSRFVARYDHEVHASRRPCFWTACALVATGLFVFQMTLIVCPVVAFGFIDQLRNFEMGELVALGFVMMLGNMLTAGSAIFTGFQRYGMATAAKIARPLARLPDSHRHVLGDRRAHGAYGALVQRTDVASRKRADLPAVIGNAARSVGLELA